MKQAQEEVDKQIYPVKSAVNNLVKDIEYILKSERNDNTLI